MVTVLNVKDLDFIKNSSYLPELTSVEASLSLVRAHLKQINLLVSKYNSTKSKVWLAALKKYCEETLSTGELYYASVSKVELCAIVAKCAQLLGEDFDTVFNSVIQSCYNSVS